MNQFFLSMDGGGSKAAYAVCDAQGHVRARVELPGLAPVDMDERELVEALSAGLSQALASAGIGRESLAAAGLGIPCLGESTRVERNVGRAVRAVYGDLPTCVVNDGLVALAGSLGLKPGINVVCGTGTIAFGVDERGTTARSGGWSHHFSDEGSGYWLGKQLLHLFCKEADYRAPRSHVYDIVRERMALDNDYDIIDIAERDYLPNRPKVASLQRWLLDAARLGDPSAIACYRSAAAEVVLCVEGILAQLRFEASPVRVSFSGGIFHVGDLIMEPIRALLPSAKFDITTPIAPPWTGGLFLAMRLVGAHTEQSLQTIAREAAESV